MTEGLLQVTASVPAASCQCRHAATSPDKTLHAVTPHSQGFHSLAAVLMLQLLVL
jgi:hypothetical protein